MTNTQPQNTPLAYLRSVRQFTEQFDVSLPLAKAVTDWLNSPHVLSQTFRTMAGDALPTWDEMTEDQQTLMVTSAVGIVLENVDDILQGLIDLKDGTFNTARGYNDDGTLLPD